MISRNGFLLRHLHDTRDYLLVVVIAMAAAAGALADKDTSV